MEQQQLRQGQGYPIINLSQRTPRQKLNAIDSFSFESGDTTDADILVETNVGAWGYEIPSVDQIVRYLNQNLYLHLVNLLDIIYIMYDLPGRSDAKLSFIQRISRVCHSNKGGPRRITAFFDRNNPEDLLNARFYIKV